MTTYCAPCLADLALVREAATAVGGTASCMAHAVLLTHPADDPQRRRQRLAQLRDTATEKLQAVGPEERVRLEILVEEYSLASAMESLVPRRRPDAHRPGDRPAERPGPRPVPGEMPLSRGARKRRARENRDRVAAPGLAPSGAPVPAAQPEEAATGAGVLPGSGVPAAEAEQVGAEALAQVGALPEDVSRAAPEAPAAAAGAAEPAAAASPAEEPAASSAATPDAPPAPADAVGQDAGSGGSAVGAAAHDDRT